MPSGLTSSAITIRSIGAAIELNSPQKPTRQTRRPSVVLSDGLATCLDSTLLFAAAIEAVGLNPIIVLTEGHCFAGVWLVEKTFSRLIETDASELRKAIAARELVVFETTLITHRPPARFNDAEKTAMAATRESAESQYQATIDITRARMSQIRPLEFHEAMSEEDKRAIDEISLSELRGLIRQNTDLLQQSDPAVAIARAMGVVRLAQSARERIAEAIDLERI